MKGKNRKDSAPIARPKAARQMKAKATMQTLIYQELRRSLTAPALNLTQAIYVSEPVKTGRIMAKDEDLCLHCGLCAERCPTGAWDMRKFTIEFPRAGRTCQSTL